MNDVIQQINLYNNLYKGCLGLSLLFLVVAITVFFMLDIKSTIGYLTGRKAKKQIKELEAANAESGRLMSKGKSMQYLDQKMKNDMGVRQAATLGIRKVENVVEPVMEPEEHQQMVLQSATKKSLRTKKIELELQDTGTLATSYTDSTQLLNNNQSETGGTYNTTVLAEETNTSYINSSTAVLDEKVSQVGHFMIIRELMLIHTEEVI